MASSHSDDVRQVLEALLKLGYEPHQAALAAGQPGGIRAALDWLDRQHKEDTGNGVSEMKAAAAPTLADKQPEQPPPYVAGTNHPGYHEKGDKHHFWNQHKNTNASAPTPVSAATLQPSTSNTTGTAALSPLSPTTSSQTPAKEVGTVRSWFKRKAGDQSAIDQKHQQEAIQASALISTYWGPDGSPQRDMIARYWAATRMDAHWNHMILHNPHDFERKMKAGYCAPMTSREVRLSTLAIPYREGSLYENAAEERLYYFLNHGTPPAGVLKTTLRPLNINRDRNTILRRGEQRNARARAIDPDRLAVYRSKHDVWLDDRRIESDEYSTQVDNVTYEARQRALAELSEGIVHGQDHLETMLMIDVSGSMLGNPYDGVVGPDNVTRYHDQPPNIKLVEHLVHRALFHMVLRARKEHPSQQGIDTVTFSHKGVYQGKISPENFKKDWGRIELGGGTQVMQGWKLVKDAFFREQQKHKHGRWDDMYGWQPTPGMPKLSLLVFLDGEAQDMDEFELELLGETWAYVTIALVGMEGCPHHHSHAIELERVSKFNPHVGFFDVHGRVCERLVVEDLLRSVYPVDPPAYEEILRPEFDLRDEKLHNPKRGY